MPAPALDTADKIDAELRRLRGLALTPPRRTAVWWSKVDRLLDLRLALTVLPPPSPEGVAWLRSRRRLTLDTP